MHVFEVGGAIVVNASQWRIDGRMSATNIAATGWRAFWANLLNPGTMSLFIAVVLLIVLVGFVFRNTISAFGFALRAGAFMLAACMIIGFAGVLGITFNGLAPLVNWFLEIVHAPLYMPEA
jgi:hypothetical protein